MRSRRRQGRGAGGTRCGGAANGGRCGRGSRVASRNEQSIAYYHKFMIVEILCSFGSEVVEDAEEQVEDAKEEEEKA